jgi:hypothetical protein
MAYRSDWSRPAIATILFCTADNVEESRFVQGFHTHTQVNPATCDKTAR